MFSTGVIAYTLLRGSTPFCDREHPECCKYGAYCIEDRVVTGNRVLNEDYRMEEDSYWNHVSDEAKDLIQSLLTVNPRNRLSAKEALAHEWMSSDIDDKLEGISLSYNFKAFEKYNRGRRNLRKFAHAAQAVIKMRKSISNATTQTAAGSSSTTSTGIESNESNDFMGITDNTLDNSYNNGLCRLCDSFEVGRDQFPIEEEEEDEERERCASTVFHVDDGCYGCNYVMPFDTQKQQSRNNVFMQWLPTKIAIHT